ncbi:hypothetical protein HNY73_016485 [Argiope bruennichi]|uniref:Uncharacterized protein n=1 Tax=Argiope bruennichi TaxID=94029 RepID=A0A8T0EIN5_ARGBR|nr:hypothetical protein HNY73_016485 [Argiope bruennichi]
MGPRKSGLGCFLSLVFSTLNRQSLGLKDLELSNNCLAGICGRMHLLQRLRQSCGHASFLPVAFFPLAQAYPLEANDRFLQPKRGDYFLSRKLIFIIMLWRQRM